jgi:hypothetical protein
VPRATLEPDTEAERHTVTDSTTGEIDNGVRDETTILLQDQVRPELRTSGEALRAMAELDAESAKLIGRAARGERLDDFDVAAFQRRHAWLAVRLPRFAEDDPDLAASLQAAADASVATWLEARDRTVRITAGWHPDETCPPTHEMRWWPSMFGAPEKWRLASSEGFLVGERPGPPDLSETELRSWANLLLHSRHVTNTLVDGWLDPSVQYPGPEDICPVYHVHTVPVVLPGPNDPPF